MRPPQRLTPLTQSPSVTGLTHTKTSPIFSAASSTACPSLRDELKSGLSGTAQKAGKEEGMSIAELAGRIKAIKSAHSVEAAPRRAEQTHFSVEEPITARIRRRTEAALAADPAIGLDANAPSIVPSQPSESMAPANPGNPMPVVGNFRTTADSRKSGIRR